MTHGVATVGIAGLGLIGGSLGLALRRSGFAERCLGWDLDAEVGQRAIELEVVAGTCDTLVDLAASVDLLIIATPTLSAEGVLNELLELARSGGPSPWITDVASVKGPLAKRALAAPAELAARFVPGHPIAGSELSGVSAADASLFAEHRAILTPLPCTDEQGLALVTRMWESTGAVVVCLSVEEHDAILAATSHLPHAVAFTLVNALAGSDSSSDIFRFAAGGFRDFTRIASSDPIMWRDIFVANSPALLEAIDAFTNQLGELRSAIESGDGPALELTFRAAKTARDDFASDLRARQRSKMAKGSG